MRFEQNADKMAQVVIAAALGKGVYAKLSPKDRAMFALKALDYGIGRARASEAPVQQSITPQQGLTFTVRDEPAVPAKPVETSETSETSDVPD